VPEREKRKRLLRLREAQRIASERARAKRVGETVAVLVEERRALRKSDPLRGALGVTHALVGRSMGEAPGVDGGIYFTGDVEIGSFAQVTLAGATAFDFFGTPARTPELVGA
jgi:tRNA A37 methylthiotransferase MiaB